jgi:DNA polymerase III delta prime subunit
MVDIHTLEPLLQSTLDGGRCSDLKEHISEASVRRNILTFKELLIPKEDTSNVTRRRMERFINNGMLSMLTNGRVNQLRDNSTKSMDFT